LNPLPPLGATGFLRGLPEPIRDRVLRRGRKIGFEKGQLIQQHGDQAREFWYVESGSVQVGRFSEDGRLTLFAVLGAGETFGELAFMGEFPRTVDALAGTDAMLVKIGEEEFQNLIQSEPAAVRLLLKTMALTVQEAFNLVEASRNLPTIERLARALIRLCGDRPAEIVISISQQELADLVGVSRVSLGKALKKLEREEVLICGYGNITIKRKKTLYSIAGG
jgi:CRP/FNR family transcriptional regulator, cyclic AMP receptor protein